MENNGTAIPAALLDSVFEAGVSTKGENRGMGLSIVKDTLEPYGGDVSCESGEGLTRFSVTLPKKSQKDDA